MRIALVAHDKKKDDIIEFAKRYKHIFEQHELLATGTTGRLLKKLVGLNINTLLSGPLGGDQQIGAKVAQGEIDFVIFLRDPLTSQPHEPDINALLRVCDIYCVPLATNVGSAEIFMKAIRSHEDIDDNE
ncbi:methylglyoxal synthase [Clostridium acetireducens DSM 10703]|jgi:methylglyoxal synthase|uniref:Methylglyoxal synthase n=1 Tax=Clostridium acetireducens DSM 10703 TaxID=1121290 RepID=A0A1E8F1J6_9CLOT|nr:methylglyoxal synthase [Clostridium acetireducens]OFI07222.1 methylglyoxal synthase [Clostridium acetireducens DSM 10703]